MGITAEPEMVTRIPWPKGIPQYEDRSSGRGLKRLCKRLAEFPGLHLTGNAYYGVGVNDCVRDAKRMADAVLGVG